jgi:hypothetical protein
MLTRIQYLLCTSVICIVAASAGMGQTSFAEFQKILHEKANFEQADLAALQFSQPIVRIAPVFDKREVAVSGVINISAGADEFLKSYRDSMRRKSNAAILEIGGFSKEPALADLQDLTIEPGDIEDLKACVVGDCQVKLSASMIERFRKEIDWESPDYQLKVTNLFKQILLDYVRDYVTRGEAALIEYNDKREEVSLANGQRALAAAPSYINYALAGQKSDLHLVEDAIVWSKIKFGLKPVLAINHITIYRRDRDVGPQVLIASRQIYANHYFNASRALTAFVSVPGAAAAAYLVYENRSLADGLEGPFSKIKREVVEKKAVEGLKAILQRSKSSLEGQPAATAEFASYRSPGWGQRLFGGIRPLLWLLVISALIALSVLGRRRTEPARKTLKPESAKS